MKLDNCEIMNAFRENMYVQYFLGLSNYTSKDVFDCSLFTTLRYCLGADKFDQMSGSLMATAFGVPNDQIENEESRDASQDNDQSKGTAHSVVEAKEDTGQ